MAHINWSCN